MSLASHLGAVVAAAALGCGWVAASERSPDAGRRLVPPSGVTCPRSHLTSYTGTVVSHRRANGVLWLRIATDWGTTERVKVTAGRGRDLSPYLLLGGRPFEPGDWEAVETAPRRRATVWVCDDGRTPIVDWQPADGVTDDGTADTSRPSARTDPR